MATRDNLHLKVEAVQHALPENIKRFSGLLSGLLTALFCLLLAYLGYRYVVVKHEEYEISKGLGGLHDGIAIPYFVSFAIVPLAYTLMALRFVGIGVLAFRGELEDTPPELRDLKKKEAEVGLGGVDPGAKTKEDPPRDPGASQVTTVKDPPEAPPDPDPEPSAAGPKTGDTADESDDSDDEEDGQ